MMPLSRSIPVFTWNRGCQFFTVISFFSPPNVPRGGEKKREVVVRRLSRSLREKREREKGVLQGIAGDRISRFSSRCHYPLPPSPNESHG